MVLNQDMAAIALAKRYNAGCELRPDQKRMMFAYTNEQVRDLNEFSRQGMCDRAAN